LASILFPLSCTALLLYKQSQFIFTKDKVSTSDRPLPLPRYSESPTLENLVMTSQLIGDLCVYSVKVRLQSQLVTRNTSLRPQSRICVCRHICATRDASLRLQSHICIYSHIFASTVTYLRLQSHICDCSHMF
jgi:hypothetical protein